MYFSSLIFLFVYLPLVMTGYYLLPKRFRNAFLLLVNLVFYGWGEPVFIIIMIVSIAVNYICGLLIEKHRENERLAKTFILLSVTISLGLLGIFKYANFVNELLRSIPLFSALPKINIPLPIGISFYTFQTMSYTIDVYRRDTKAQKSIVDFGTYVSFFPQLIAGPIVRYRDVAVQLENRRENITQFASGVRRFVVGLAKKVLIANQMGLMWDTLRPNAAQNGFVGAWIGIAAYSLQIYFDFSAYSDMAIGLGRMFGFEFMENFNYPYISRSITEFWRRWHISLSTWFRDYVYIPLGGNRCSMPRHIFNLFAVWALTGFWHGASLNFMTWGIFFFVMLIMEKFLYGKALSRMPAVVGHVYTLFVLMISWVMFYFEDFSQMGQYVSYMFGAGEGVLSRDAASVALAYLPIMAVSIFVSTPCGKLLYSRLRTVKFGSAAELAGCAFMLALCTAALVSQSYNPFLYFRF